MKDTYNENYKALVKEMVFKKAQINEMTTYVHG
jgi:hypothetical protein